MTLDVRLRFVVCVESGPSPGWDSDYPTFAAAERRARELVQQHPSWWVQVNRDGICLATVRTDAFERVWTDLDTMNPLFA